MYLQIKNAAVGYASPLFSNVDTALDLGEICLLIGSNGAGKTTLIKSILNQIPLIDGEIYLNSKKVDELSAKDISRLLAVVFSKSSIPTDYTVEDLVSLGKYIHYPYYFNLKKEDVDHVDFIIESLHLTPYKNFRLTRLSDGNLQKAFIGRALSQNTPYIILDEPTTHLDEENKIMILQLLRHLGEEQKKLILFSSHDWRLAKEFSDKIWYIKNDSLQAGLAEDVISQNKELLQPKLFYIHSDFLAPRISAPSLHKELLFSFLQKNFKKDLSSFDFMYSQGKWNISNVKTQHIAHNFEEILKVLRDYR